MTVKSDEIDPLVEWMRARGVRRLRMPDGLEVELEPGGRVPHASSVDATTPAEPESVAPPAQAFADADGAGVCACGHSWLEHNDAGCFFGCSWSVCTSSSTAEPEGTP